jgi:hypothetical protein
MKIIFVSGPYRAPTKQGIDANIYAAMHAAKELWRSGFAVICPHANTANFDGAVPDEIFLEGDLEILRRCDCIFMMAGWESSEGSKGEYELALALGLDVYYEQPPGIV